jgi:hypothetical protein
MKIDFICDSGKEQKGSFNPRFIMGELIPVIEKHKEVISVTFEYDGYYGNLYIKLYDENNKLLQFLNREKNNEFYDKIIREINVLPEFILNGVYAWTRGWGEVYISVGLNR